MYLKSTLIPHSMKTKGSSSQQVPWLPIYLLLWKSLGPHLHHLKSILFSSPLSLKVINSIWLDWDFPGGAMDKNLPANAGDSGFNPWSGKILHAAEQLSPCSKITEPTVQSLWAENVKPLRREPMLCNKRSYRKEKPMCCNGAQPLLPATRESPRAAIKTQHNQK